MDEKQANAAAHMLLTSHSALIGGLLSHLMQAEIQTFTDTLPKETERREQAYHKLQAIKDIDSLLRNMATQHQASMKQQPGVTGL